MWCCLERLQVGLSVSVEIRSLQSSTSGRNEHECRSYPPIVFSWDGVLVWAGLGDVIRSKVTSRNALPASATHVLALCNDPHPAAGLGCDDPAPCTGYRCSQVLVSPSSVARCHGLLTVVSSSRAPRGNREGKPGNGCQGREGGGGEAGQKTAGWTAGKARTGGVRRSMPTSQRRDTRISRRMNERSSSSLSPHG